MIKPQGVLFMDKIVIEAVKRTEKPNKVRREGFIPAVINGPGTASMSVQFKTAELNKIFEKYGLRAKLWIKTDGKEKLGLIKEIQREPVGGKITHISIQLVTASQNIEQRLPIIFEGNDALKLKMLKLQVEKSETEVEGKAGFMPSSIVADVSQKKYGDNVTAADFKLPSQIKLIASNNEIYATVKGKNSKIAEETEETEKSALT
ncbi:MAG TPA: 50S ribosomal protein L25 [Marinilabiliaceae bacterium]|jgi:large subunit ribosomal protein L25|nr:50S ribosomal protein L25 [Marinilabiliaceae bacterium]